MNDQGQLGLLPRPP